MAFTVTANLTNIDLAESATPWSTGTLDADFYVQGSNSIGFYMAKNVRGSNTVTPAASVAWSAYTYPHLYFWMNSSVAAKMTAKSTGTTTASGVTVRVTLANSAYREWHVTGSDTWDGGWAKAFVIDMSHTGTQLYASSGTWTNSSNIASVTWYFDLSTSGNIRNVPANCWLDAIRVGEGLQVHNTSGTDPSFDFEDIAANDELTANRYGVLEIKDGIVFCQGALEIGDNSSTNHLDFDSQDEVLVFSDRDGSGEGLVHASLYDISFVGNSTGTDQDVNFGVKVGTGDTASGRNGTIIRAGGSMTWSMDLADANVHSFTAYGSTFRNAEDGIGSTGSPATAFEIAGSTFDGCDQIDTRDATVRNCNFLNTVAVSTSGALLWDENEVDVKYSLFVNNLVAVEIPTLTADATFVGMEFSGNTNDVRYEGASDYDLNWSDASGAPTIQNAGAGTLTAQNTVTYTVTGLVNDSEVTILDLDVAAIDITGTASNQNVGTTTVEKAGQSFQVASAGDVDRVRIKLRKVGTPTDSIICRIVNGVPGSTELADSFEIDAADLTTSYVEHDFQLTAVVTLATSTTYGIEFERTGATSATNYYQIEYDTSSVDGTGVRYTHNGASWSSTTGDLLLAVMEDPADHQLFNDNSVTTGSTTYTHGGVTKSISLLVAHVTYKQVILYDTLGGTAATVPVVQIPDYVYKT